MTVLVLVEHEGGAVKDPTLAAVTAAGKLGAVHALVAGDPGDAKAAAGAAAKIAGVEKVLLAADAAYAHALPENVAPLAAGLMANYDAFVAPATRMSMSPDSFWAAVTVLWVESRTTPS